MTERPLRLLFVIKSLAIKAGGAERILSVLSSALSERGHLVEVASFDDPDTADFYAFNPRVRRRKLGIGQIEASTGPVEVINRTRQLRRLITEAHPDVVIGFMHSAFVPLAIAAIGTGVPVVASEHTAVIHYKRRRAQLMLVRAVAPLLAAVTTQSNRIRAEYPKSIARMMRVVPNPVAFRADGKRPPSGPKKMRLLLSVGRFRAEKGQVTLVEAFSKVEGAFPQWSLRLVGDGPCFDEVKRRVAELGLLQRVQLPGALENIASEYQSADLVAVPSSYESFGLVTAEALASGVPVVGFADCPGTNELVSSGVNGLLVEGSDRVASLADGLRQLMSDNRLRKKLGQAGPASIRQYSLDAVTDLWEALLSSVADRTASAPSRPEAL